MALTSGSLSLRTHVCPPSFGDWASSADMKLSPPVTVIKESGLWDFTAFSGVV